MDKAEQTARRRFAVLSLVRFSAVGIAFIGAANIGGKLFPALSPLLGQLLLVIATIDFFAAPALLKSFWRKSDQ